MQELNIFQQVQSKESNIAIFYQKNSHPRKFVLYDTDYVPGCRGRIERLHPELVFIGSEEVITKQEARQKAAAFNLAMKIYPEIYRKYTAEADLIDRI